MSDRMTSVHLNGLPMGAGYAEWGLREPKEMIGYLRQIARQQLLEAEKILAASDEDFRVETYVGVHVRRQLRVLQEGKKP